MNLALLTNWLSLPLALQDYHKQTMWMPQQSSTLAPHMDLLFYWIFWLCMFFLVLITAALIWLIWRFRQRPGHSEQPSPHHNFALEVTWSIIPLFIVIVIFWLGYVGFLDLRTPPPNALEIAVQGQQWTWTFQYPKYHGESIVSNELHVPVDTPVVTTMTSVDVIHAFYVPDFRVKQDVVPGRYSKVWFQAVAPGEHNLFCAEYCGKGHSDMITKVVVEPPGGYEKWLDQQIAIQQNLPPADLGKHIYETRGCKQCHSTDGTVGTGPSFKGVFGHPVKLADGTTITADENYVHQSVMDPPSQVVAGFQPVMPTFKGKLSDHEITGIIEFLKTLSQ